MRRLSLPVKWGLAGMLLLASCMNKEKVPHNLIPQDKMKEILTDMHYADAYAFQEFKGDSIYRAATGMYTGIFEKYGVDTAAFNASFNYYIMHPKQLDKMYQAMIDSLNARETRLTER